MNIFRVADEKFLPSWFIGEKEDKNSPKEEVESINIAEEVDDGTEGEVEASETEVDETEVEETETEETEEVETEKPDSTSLPSTKITRIQAVGMAFKNNPKGITRADLVSKSDAIYADSGGKPNEKEAKWAVKVVLDSIGAVGLLNESNGKFSV